MTVFCFYEFPIGRVGIGQTDESISHVIFQGEKNFEIRETPLIQRAAAQIEEYFNKGRREFDLPLAPVGTPFQTDVWNALKTIPYGETRTYQQVAVMVGRPKACRAVGMANHNNPISIIIPCHRVIGADGGLTGYGGGLDAKKFLLSLEQNNLSEIRVSKP